MEFFTDYPLMAKLVSALTFIFFISNLIRLSLYEKKYGVEFSWFWGDLFDKKEEKIAIDPPAQV
jgi:hypothetical protein